MEEVRQSKRTKYSEEKEDRISDLPDCILHHIMGFMDTKYAVQTSLLSKRWNYLWSGNPILRLHHSFFRRLTTFAKFVSWVLSHRDGSISLHNLDFHYLGRVRLQLLSRLIRYAVRHKIQQLNISVSNNLILPPCLFSCHSLTRLTIEVCKCNTRDKLPKSLDFPMLTTLHLKYVTFSACENGYIEPFPNCPKLKKLILVGCVLPNPKVLTISAPQLTNLTIHLSHPNYFYKESYKFMLSTPNLSNFVFSGFSLPILCGNNLPLLEEADIHADFSRIISNEFDIYRESTTRLMDMFQLLANVKSLTLSKLTLKALSSNPDLLNNWASPFRNLKSLKLKLWEHSSAVPDHVISYLLKNSPGAETIVIHTKSDH